MHHLLLSANYIKVSLYQCSENSALGATGNPLVGPRSNPSFNTTEEMRAKAVPQRVTVTTAATQGPAAHQDEYGQDEYEYPSSDVDEDGWNAADDRIAETLGSQIYNQLTPEKLEGAMESDVVNALLAADAQFLELVKFCLRRCPGVDSIDITSSVKLPGRRVSLHQLAAHVVRLKNGGARSLWPFTQKTWRVHVARQLLGTSDRAQELNDHHVFELQAAFMPVCRVVYGEQAAHTFSDAMKRRQLQIQKQQAPADPLPDAADAAGAQALLELQQAQPEDGAMVDNERCCHCGFVHREAEEEEEEEEDGPAEAEPMEECSICRRMIHVSCYGEWLRERQGGLPTASSAPGTVTVAPSVICKSCHNDRLRDDPLGLNEGTARLVRGGVERAQSMVQQELQPERAPATAAGGPGGRRIAREKSGCYLLAEAFVQGCTREVQLHDTVPGSCIAVVGNQGVGKSTLLSCFIEPWPCPPPSSERLQLKDLEASKFQEDHKKSHPGFNQPPKVLQEWVRGSKDESGESVVQQLLDADALHRHCLMLLTVDNQSMPEVKVPCILGRYQDGQIQTATSSLAHRVSSGRSNHMALHTMTVADMLELIQTRQKEKAVRDWMQHVFTASGGTVPSSVRNSLKPAIKSFFADGALGRSLGRLILVCPAGSVAPAAAVNLTDVIDMAAPMESKLYLGNLFEQMSGCKPDVHPEPWMRVVKMVDSWTTSALIPRSVSYMDLPGLGDSDAMRCWNREKALPLATAVVVLLDGDLDSKEATLKFMEKHLLPRAIKGEVKVKVFLNDKDKVANMRCLSSGVYLKHFESRNKQLNAWMDKTRTTLLDKLTSDRYRLSQPDAEALVNRWMGGVVRPVLLEGLLTLMGEDPHVIRAGNALAGEDPRRFQIQIQDPHFQKALVYSRAKETMGHLRDLYSHNPTGMLEACRAKAGSVGAALSKVLEGLEALSKTAGPGRLAELEGAAQQAADVVRSVHGESGGLGTGSAQTHGQAGPSRKGGHNMLRAQMRLDSLIMREADASDPTAQNTMFERARCQARCDVLQASSIVIEEAVKVVEERLEQLEELNGWEREGMDMVGKMRDAVEKYCSEGRAGHCKDDPDSEDYLSAFRPLFSLASSLHLGHPAVRACLCLLPQLYRQVRIEPLATHLPAEGPARELFGLLADMWCSGGEPGQEVGVLPLLLDNYLLRERRNIDMDIANDLGCIIRSEVHAMLREFFKELQGLCEQNRYASICGQLKLRLSDLKCRLQGRSGSREAQAEQEQQPGGSGNEASGRGSAPRQGGASRKKGQQSPFLALRLLSLVSTKLSKQLMSPPAPLDMEACLEHLAGDMHLLAEYFGHRRREEAGKMQEAGPPDERHGSRLARRAAMFQDIQADLKDQAGVLAGAMEGDSDTQLRYVAVACRYESLLRRTQQLGLGLRQMGQDDWGVPKKPTARLTPGWRDQYPELWGALDIPTAPIDPTDPTQQRPHCNIQGLYGELARGGLVVQGVLCETHEDAKGVRNCKPREAAAGEEEQQSLLSQLLDVELVSAMLREVRLGSRGMWFEQMTGTKPLEALQAGPGGRTLLQQLCLLASHLSASLHLVLRSQLKQQAAAHCKGQAATGPSSASSVASPSHTPRAGGAGGEPRQAPATPSQKGKRLGRPPVNEQVYEVLPEYLTTSSYGKQMTIRLEVEVCAAGSYSYRLVGIQQPRRRMRQQASVAAPINSEPSAAGPAPQQPPAPGPDPEAHGQQPAEAAAAGPSNPPGAQAAASGARGPNPQGTSAAQSQPPSLQQVQAGVMERPSKRPGCVQRPNPLHPGNARWVDFNLSENSFEVCLKCRRGSGTLLICSHQDPVTGAMCPNTFHPRCVGLRRMPPEEQPWYCCKHVQQDGEQQHEQQDEAMGEAVVDQAGAGVRGAAEGGPAGTSARGGSGSSRQRKNRQGEGSDGDRAAKKHRT